MDIWTNWASSRSEIWACLSFFLSGHPFLGDFKGNTKRRTAIFGAPTKRRTHWSVGLCSPFRIVSFAWEVESVYVFLFGVSLFSTSHLCQGGCAICVGDGECFWFSLAFWSPYVHRCPSKSQPSMEKMGSRKELPLKGSRWSKGRFPQAPEGPVRTPSQLPTPSLGIPYCRVDPGN